MNTDDTQKIKDKNTFGARLNRYKNVGFALSGLAGKMATSQLFSDSHSAEKNAKEIRQILGNLKGPLMKVAQILTTIPDALPKEYTQELIELQTNAPPMSWNFIKRRMVSELGVDWQSKFKHFDTQAFGAASLGQVHRATHHDGRDLACKLQYPNMSSIIEADLKQLKLLFSLYRISNGVIETDNILLEISERMREELDYILESQHTQLYRFMLKDLDTVRIPEPIEELSTRQLISMTWLEGNSILTYKQHSQELRNHLAVQLFKTWYYPLFKYGIIHGDPHLGNYSVSQDEKINLLDFGCVRKFNPTFVASIHDLYKAILTDDSDLAVHAYKNWGFKDISFETIETLNIWVRFIFDAWIDDTVRPLHNGTKSSGVYGRETLKKVYQRLKQQGTISLPREIVFMDRAALGMGSVFMHLDARLNWHQLMEEILQEYDPNTLQQNQDIALSECGLRPTPDPES